MQYTHLGRTGLVVSELCLGTMNFGPFTSEADSFAIMDRALEAGVNFYDTANNYGGNLGPDRGHRGWTEEIIGRWFKQGGGRREKVVLATKVYTNASAWPNDGKLSARHIKMECEASLRRLQVDCIELYQMHHIDRATPWEEIWEAMAQLRAEGKIIYCGSSNFAGWHIAQAQEKAADRHFLGLVSEQSIYNLNTRAIELEVIPACQAYGLGLIIWSPLAGGLLGGALQKQEDGSRSGRMAAQIEKMRPQLEAYENIAKELGIHPANLGLAWLLHQPAVTAPIIGPRTLEQLECALDVPEIELDDAVLAKLDDLFPGPGGPAPEAYAW